MAEDTIQDIVQRLTKIETLLENMTQAEDLKNQILEEKIKANENKIKVANNRIADLEDSNKWLIRLTIGGLITGAIGLLFAFIK